MAIKVFYSDQAGAPVLNGVIGSLIDVLDGCLVSGYNEIAIATIIRSGSLVTVETVGDHGFTSPRDNYWSADGIGSFATIAGADQLEYNGVWPVTVIDSRTFKFDIGVASPESPATGLMTCKRAPAGFAKPFEGVGIGIYRSNDPTSRKFYLKVNDTGDSESQKGGMFAWWRGYERMTSADVGEFPFPSYTQSGKQGQRIRKSNSPNESGRRWTIVSDGKAFCMITYNDTGMLSTGVGSYSGGYFFGDFMPLAPDPYAVFIEGDTSSASDPNTNSNAGLFMPSGQYSPNPGSGSGWSCIARRYNGQATPVWAAGKLGHGFPTYCFGTSAYLSYPDPFSNRLHAAQIKLFDGAIFRGLLPLYESLSGRVHADREIVRNIAGREGRVFIFLRGHNFNPSYSGGLYVDVTGEENGRWT